jgi:beta-galactosidase
VYRDVPLLLSGPKLQLWRAPVDNDVQLAKAWRKAGYDRLVTLLKGFSLERAEADAVRIAAEAAVGARGEKLAFRLRLVYTIAADGSVLLETELEPQGELPPLPRFGLELRLPERFDRLAWFGRGPHECYADRKESGKLGVYGGPVQEQFVPYIKPQENGNKADVRWSTVTDGDGTGLLFSSDALFNTSAHHYSTAQLTLARHVHELDRLPETVVKLDAAQSGLGNHSCGYAPTLDKYLLPPQRMTFAVRIAPVGPGYRCVTGAAAPSG